MQPLSLRASWPTVLLWRSTIGASELVAHAGSSPFSAPRAMRAEADAAREKLRLACSDHITLVRTFELWYAARANGKQDAFCKEHWVSKRVMNEVQKTRNQYLRTLQGLQLHDGHEDGVFNANRTSVAALQAMLCAGLYPNLAEVSSRSSE